jgi:4,5-DOPA dioxygenase extradiol
MNAVEDTQYRRGWVEVARQWPRPKAILCISAHWETRGVYVSAADWPETLHDFYGFPRSLFDVRYPAPGDPALAQRISKAVSTVPVHLDPDRGLDHGVWSVLVAMYPAADVPVIQLSLDSGRPGAFHYDLAKQLEPLRDEGILIIGSGNVVHNLRLFQYHDATPADWSVRFDTEVRQRVLAGDHDALVEYAALGRDAQLAVPTPEHYLPLLYVLALRDAHDRITVFNDAVISTLSMTSYLLTPV